MTSVIDEGALRLDPVRVGGFRPPVSTPDRFVTVFEDESPILRVDLYSYGADAFVFEESIIWRDILIVGYGSHVHAISLVDRSARTIELRGYFSRLYPTSEYMLIVSGERLFRMAPDRSIQWTSDVLGIDGVVVRETTSTIIRGDGEWDPPGGWKPFAVSALDGSSVSP